ncbi:MAG: SpoIIE family protein phosphatase [Phycisphaerae bacterium]|nr:SpoIIE family protein phosphatase [Phycisphaerae bacterium]
MTGKPKLLWVGQVPAPANVVQAAGGWEFAPYNSAEPLGPQLKSAVLAVICPNGRTAELPRLAALIEQIEETDGLSVMLLDRQADTAWQLVSNHQGRLLCMPDDTPAAELAARFEALAAVQPLIWNLQAELSAANNLSRSAGSTVRVLNEEMRLAARLQRDFLPRKMPDVPPVRFAVLFRPAGWVSGDIYDVSRLDETHVGFYVLDAVGHGMPAALLTMFIRKALQTKHIDGHSYEIVPPEVSLAELNSSLCEQHLSICQFCTAVYGVLDVAELKLTYARAGHPMPLVLRADGSIEHLSGAGTLLGVFPEASFEPRQVQLAGGDRVVMYTDGIEEALRRSMRAPQKHFGDMIAPWAKLAGRQLLVKLTEQIDRGCAQSKHQDDMTVVVVQVDQ